jgi:hypothetical protein
LKTCHLATLLLGVTWAGVSPIVLDPSSGPAMTNKNDFSITSKGLNGSVRIRLSCQAPLLSFAADTCTYDCLILHNHALWKGAGAKDNRAGFNGSHAVEDDIVHASS